jgi:signal transduction histidine kinase
MRLVSYPVTIRNMTQRDLKNTSGGSNLLNPDPIKLEPVKSDPIKPDQQLESDSNSSPSNPEGFDIALPSSLLERFTGLLISNPTLEELIEESFAGIHDVFEIDAIALLMPDSEVSGIAFSRSLQGPVRLQPNPISSSDPWFVARMQTPDFAVRGSETGGSPLPQFEAIGTVPLVALDGQNMGLLAFVRSEGQEFSVAQRHALIAVSRIIGSCLERSRGRQAIDRAGNETNALLALSRLLEGERDTVHLRRTALETLRPHFPGATLAFVGSTNTSIQAIDYEGDERLMLMSELLLGVPESQVQAALESGQAIFLDEYRQVLDHNPALLAAGIASLACAPLKSQGGLIEPGALLALRRARRRPWSDLERRLLLAAARTISVTLERIEARRALEEARERAEFLAALSDALQRTQTAEEVAQTAMHWLGPALHAQNILTLRVGSQAVTAMGAWGEVPSTYQGYFAPDGVLLTRTQLIKTIVESGEPIYEMRYEALGRAEDRLIAVGLEPIKDSSARVLAIFSVAREPRFGEWREAEREFLKRAASTVGLALERTRAREQLEAQNRALEGKSSEMEAFVYSVSHDLKAPMVSLEGMSTLLLEALDEGNFEDVTFFVGRLRANVSTMSSLVNNLLELSRVGRVEEQDDTLDVGAVVANVLDELEASIRAKSISVVLPDSWPKVRFPGSRLYQVYANLVGNAVKFMPLGRAKAQINLEWNFVPGGLDLIVRDNGPGIPTHLQGRVFELFSRLHPEIQGTGMGLTMVKAIIESKGGRIWLSSEPDSGLAVCFHVPGSRVYSIPEAVENLN